MTRSPAARPAAPRSVAVKGQSHPGAARGWLIVGSSAAVTVVIGILVLRQLHRAPTSPASPVAPERAQPEIVPLTPAAERPEPETPPEPVRPKPAPLRRRKPRPTAARASAPAPAQAVVEPGFLTLDSAPWAQVSLAGKPLGSTPLIRVPLPPGQHTLTLRNPELGTSTTYVVEIEPGATASRFVGWDRP